MTESSDPKPTAFVVMPSGDNFAGIYEHIITPALEEAGYHVVLAVEINSAQNVVKDIVQGLAESTLILADVTGSNRNVYYELGIAHTLGKPTILITQDIKDLPFDIHSYRAIEYDERVGRYSEAQSKIKSLAEGLLNGTVKFGSPVYDFLSDVHSPASQQPVPSDQQSDSSGSPSEEEGDPGFLNFLEDLEDGSEELAEVTQGFNQQTSDMSARLQEITELITERQGRAGPGRARDVRTLVLGAAAELNTYANALDTLNKKYSESLNRVHTGFEGVLQTQELTSDEERRQLAELLEVIGGTITSSDEALEGVDGMIGALHGLVNIERTFDRARRRTVDQLHGFKSNLDRTKATFVRIVEIGEGRLRTEPDEQGEPV